MTAASLPPGKQTFVDLEGHPLIGGWVYHYIPNTTVFKDTWQDYDQTVLNTNPIELDERGQAMIYGTGNYRQRLTDADGNEIWDRNTTVGQQGDIVLAWGSIFGMKLANGSDVSSKRITITVGQARDSTNTADIIFNITHYIDLALVGAGGRDSMDALAAGQSYHIFALLDPDSGDTAVVASQSATNPVVPAPYTLFRRIGSLPRLGGMSSPPSGTDIPLFLQFGDEFQLSYANNEYAAQSGSTAALLRAFLTPLGIKTNAIMYGQLTLSPNTGVRLRVTGPDLGVPPPQSGAPQFAQVRLDVNETYNAAVFYATTNTNAQVYVQVSDALGLWAVKSIGWIDPRQLVG